ncbi:uncharacterized protein V6R79_003089 [Siganus canaliculatus]
MVFQSRRPPLGPAGDVKVDVLEFLVPVDNNKALFVWGIEPWPTEAQIYDHLSGVFLTFGPLYLLKVFPNAPLSPPGFYALVKFYSAAQASAAQRQTDGRRLFQRTPLKVRLSSKQTPHFLSGSSQLLSHARCLELANHCLGFNGWTSEIVTLKQLTNEEEEDRGERWRRLKFGCLLRLHFPRHHQTTSAAAVVEDTFTCSGAELLLQKRCQLQKRVREKALVQAFSRVLLLLIGDGKVMVEVKQTSDQCLPEQTEGVLQVNHFTWSQLTPDEDEEEEWDLSLHSGASWEP